MVIGHHVEIETVPQRVARAALQLDETGVNGNSFHAQTAQLGTVSVVWAWFKSPLAHISDWPRVPDPGLRPLRDSGLLP